MASLPEPVAGLVIRYSYLWRSEHRRGQEEGEKDRPCAIVLVVEDKLRGRFVTVLPITHSPPKGPGEAVELAPETKHRLGLDNNRSWVILTEANRFRWPGPDLRRADPENPQSFAFGPLPYSVFMRIRNGFLAILQTKAAVTIDRTE